VLAGRFEPAGERDDKRQPWQVALVSASLAYFSSVTTQLFDPLTSKLLFVAEALPRDRRSQRAQRR